MDIRGTHTSLPTCPHPAALSYTVTGTGPPLVLIHGLAGSRRWWARTIAGVAPSFQVYALDLLGFGTSQSGDPFVLHDAAALLVCWLDYVGLDRVTLVGHSMGGVVAAQLAARWPARVTQMVLVDAAVLPIAIWQLPLNLLRAAWYTPTSLWPILLTDVYRAGPWTLLTAVCDLIMTDLRADLPHIRMPTLVVWGAQDRLIPLSVGHQLCHLLPNAQLVVLPQAGHSPMWARPAAFNQTLCTFLRSQQCG